MSDNFVNVATFPNAYNISPLLVHFTENGVDYRIETEAEGQILFVSEAHAARVMRFLDSIQAGVIPDESLSDVQNPALNLVKKWPVTIIIILMGGLGFLLARFDPNLVLLKWFTYVSYDIQNSRIISHSFEDSVILSWEWWRLITPAFLHFSPLHILFNAAGIWELGRRLEMYLGRVTYIFMFVAIVQISNFVEYFFSQYALFGGLSGAVFGFVGLIAALSFRTSSPILRLPKGMYVVVVLWAVFGVTGIVNKIFGIQMADGAHIGGLICGAILGLVFPIKKRKKIK